ncbi:Uncharacterised protein [Raoultella terrigena]|uniref:Uncharacterized protein n=1 Tax=Raoultella terrigena TaxID=577 RepID=A0A3P8IZG1_RAOTE|nr:Uncharacterised protein [Raoultella terrigena]
MMPQPIASSRPRIRMRINNLRDKMLSLSLIIVLFHRLFWIVMSLA